MWNAKTAGATRPKGLQQFNTKIKKWDAPTGAEPQRNGQQMPHELLHLQCATGETGNMDGGGAGEDQRSAGAAVEWIVLIKSRGVNLLCNSQRTPTLKHQNKEL